MRVIIIGGGAVGTELARKLSPDHDVVVIEQKDTLTRKLSMEIDCQLITGNGASTATLERAGVRSAGLLIAVTETDEVNIIASMLAKKFGVEKTVARLRNNEYTDGKHMLKSELMGIDYVINPERVAAEEITQYILNPGTTDCDYYAGGRIQVSGYRVDGNFPYLQLRLEKIKMPPSSIICAIIRGKNVIIPGGKDEIHKGDEIYVLGKTSTRSSHFFGIRREAKNQRIVIAGGGLVGFQLAKLLEESTMAPHVMKVIDKDKSRCEKLCEDLLHAQVYHGDVTDVRFLKNVHIYDTDIFIAATGDDEINLLSTLLARKLGAKKTVSEVIRPDYQLILDSIGIDKVVSPRLLTATIIMRLIRKGNIVSMTILRDGMAQMMEAVAAYGAPFVGKRIKEMGLPKGVLLGAIARKEKIIVPDGNERICAGDRIVIFLLPEHTTTVAEIFSGKSRHVVSFPALHKISAGKKG